MSQQQPAPPAASGVEVHRWPVPVGHDQRPPAAGVLAWWRQRPPVLCPMATSPVAAARVVVAAVAAAEAGGRLLYRAFRSLPTVGTGPATASGNRGVALAGGVGPVVTRLHASWTYLEIHWSSG